MKAKDLRTYLPYIAAFFFLQLYFSIVVFSVTWDDYWRHLAIIASFQRNLLTPEHETLSASAAFLELHTPWHFAAALIGRLFHLHPLLAMQATGTIGFALYLGAMLYFFSSYYPDLKKRLQATLFFLFLSMFVRVFLWPWSGENGFRTLHFTPTFPGFFGCTLLFFSYALGEKILARKKPRDLLLLSPILGLTFVVHPLSGAALALQIAIQGIQALRQKPRWDQKLALYLGATLTLGGLLTALWPYYSLLRWLGLSGVSEVNAAWTYERAWKIVGPYVCVAFPLLWFFRREKRYETLMLLIAANGVLYVVAFLLRLDFFERHLLFFMRYVQVFLALTLYDLWRERRNLDRGKKRILLIATTIILLTCLISPENRRALPWSLRVFQKTLRAQPSFFAVHQSRMAMLVAHLHPGDVVWADPPFGWHIDEIAAFTGAKFVATRFAYTHPQYRERLADAERFFTTLTPAERRALNTKYGATHMLISKDALRVHEERGEKLAFLPQPLDESDRYLLYEIPAPSP